jgi:hypothetical protein
MIIYTRCSSCMQDASSIALQKAAQAACPTDYHRDLHSNACLSIALYVSHPLNLLTPSYLGGFKASYAASTSHADDWTTWWEAQAGSKVEGFNLMLGLKTCYL